MSIRVRFAPSPTGALHIGGIRTALYNYLLAKKHGGTFILRIEDTDQGRFVAGAEQYIIDALKWLGIAPTEGVGFGDGPHAPYRQSDRKDLYNKYVKQLIESGAAYYAFDTPAELEAMRATLEAEKAANTSYSSATRTRPDLNLQNALTLPAATIEQYLVEGKPSVIRLKIAANETITVNDLIKGDFSLETNALDDKVLMKADGMPTYHLANIIDDYDMKISHVIRGEEWLSSLGHHVLLYRAFGWESVMPKFAHLPLILRPDGKGKLSKRDGQKFGFPVFPLDWNGEKETFEGFKGVGFDPRAVVNFLALLGWGTGSNEEFYTLEELVEKFSIEKISQAGARFNYDKAKWFNQEYIKKTPNETLAAQLHPLSIERGYTVSEAFLAQFAGLMKERVTFLNDFLETGYYFFEDPKIELFDEQTVTKRWKPENRDKFHDLKELIGEMTFDDPLSMESEVKNFINENGLKIGDVLPLLRIALAGTLQGPAVFDMAVLLGKETVVRRLSKAFSQFDKLAKINKIEPVMNIIEKQIVDLRIRKIVTDHPDWFTNMKDEKQKISKAFVILAVSVYLKVELSEALNLLTEGGHDAGIDAIYIGDVVDYEFSVTIFQAKYVFDLDKDANFPANSVGLVTNSVKNIFDSHKVITANPLLRAQIAEISSRTADYFPNIKCVFVNNGLKWKEDGQNHIDNSRSERVSFEYFNHVDIINSIKNTKAIEGITLRLSGSSFVENFNYKRVLVGKINIVEIAHLFEQFGDALLESNIRKYLGSQKNSVNEAMIQTLTSDKKDNFYFYNNGVTMVCNKFTHNDLETRDWRVRADGLQIINGGQSCKTILETFKNNPNIDYSQAYILVRLYELTGKDVEQLVSEVTLATNSQNPVDLRDLRANDSIQKNLILSIKELNYVYKPKRDISANGDVIPSSVAAEAVYAIWRKRPHQAKFMQRELFGKFYYDIFNTLNGAQLVLAVLIYRFCDNQRRKEALILQYPHIPYSNYFLSMIMAFIVLKDLKIDGVAKLTHLNFDEAKQYFEANKEQLFERSNQVLIKALNNICPEPRTYDKLELRSLSAIFRRGDLMEYIDL